MASGTSNITLAVDAQMIERAREVARQQGTSLNALIRQYIEQLAGHRTGADLFGALQQLWAEGSGRSSEGYEWKREDAYEGRRLG
jgi:hypothetical protein